MATINDRPPKLIALGFIALVSAAVHFLVFYAETPYLSFDANELFLIGYGLVFLDGGLFGFIAIRLIGHALRSTA